MRLSNQQFVWALGALCALHKIPFDSQLLIRSFVPPYDLTSLQTALQSYGFQTALETLDLHNIHPAVFPVLTFLKPLETSTENIDDKNVEPQVLTLSTAIILKCDKERVLWIRPGVEQPETIPYQEYAVLATGQVLLATKRVETNAQDLEAAQQGGHPSAKTIKATAGKAQQPFGFKWFIPELLKHKAVWREILLASLPFKSWP